MNKQNDDVTMPPMTAYASNTRTLHGAGSEVDQRWHETIRRLVADDYAFTALQYTEPGILFRGMSSGLLSGLENDALGQFEDDNPHAGLENSLQVLFVSQDLSDGVTCSRLWESHDDAGIVVIDTHAFNTAYNEGTAAMMQFAEPGVVFNYPLFCDPFRREQIRLLFVNKETHTELIEAGIPDMTAMPEIIVIDEQERGACEKVIRRHLDSRQLEKGVPMAVHDYPGKRT